jgi:hypothetical protein
LLFVYVPLYGAWGQHPRDVGVLMDGVKLARRLRTYVLCSCSRRRCACTPQLPCVCLLWDLVWGVRELALCVHCLPAWWGRCTA